MAKTVFQNSKLFQHATFTFKVSYPQEDDKVDARGNKLQVSRELCVTFQIKPTTSGSTDRRDHKAVSTENYKAKVVMVDGKTHSVLPCSINVGDVAEVISVAQSSVYPITRKIIGDEVTLLVRYRSNGEIGTGFG